MSRSLSLAAYLAYARRTGKPGVVPDIPRPGGPLIWAHAVDAARADTLVHLAERLAQQRPGAHMVLTTSGPAPERLKAGGPVIWQPLPEDSIPAAEAFLDHWTPDIVLWTGGDLKPALLICADKADIPRYLVDADEPLLERPAWRWFPDMPRAVLGGFVTILARSEAAARVLRRYGAPDSIVHVTGPFQEGTMALAYNHAEREELASLLRSRPIWLGAMIQVAELNTLLSAHRDTSRLAHRSLLIIVPDNLDDTPAIREVLDAQGWRYVVWSEGELPTETTQVILADTRGEMGLWYRLSPITFMGSSLVSGQYGRDPNEPAAHGSAILYGPNVGRYLNRYSRYAEAGAARIVRDTGTLAAAVQRLIAPDQAATMAHAAWDVASKGAAVTDSILDLLLDRLDLLEAKR
ncbi:3-deoxy-D-manno-octulosonic-acid transferase [Roseovarius marisflavi]|uniref:3-deoxy-D-manno-octulosonic acid transferase n=1 Tax=Roseovarius marisflavi TaxID=1054996 RepID=A0A1M6Z1Q3_9RHOB|nr:glycosyltransferase N-terminal domain-containing protein [Roseovarius marisflavi]SHL24305.1 3-deoxy-D-manno-octulosonic-acid transferase [Roseovarius marisflavi]